MTHHTISGCSTTEPHLIPRMLLHDTLSVLYGIRHVVIYKHYFKTPKAFVNHCNQTYCYNK